MNNDPKFIQLQESLDKQYNPQIQQITALEDIANIVQDISVRLDSIPSVGGGDKFGSLLIDIRESLAAIKNKEDPAQPDYSKPVVEAVKKLETALASALKVTVNAPDVKVNASKVDLKGVEKVLQIEIPQAFQQAIKSIPEVNIPEADYTSITAKLDDVTEWLKSIDKASRMKPQMPTQLKVVNPDGSNVGTGGVATVTNDGTFATPARQDTGNTSLSTIAAKDFATQTTLALIKAKTDNLDVATSTRTKPADQQHAIIDSSALPSGAATSANQLTGLMPKVFDAFTYTATSGTVDTYQYYTGGTGGSLVATLTVTFTAADHLVLVSGVRT